MNIGYITVHPANYINNQMTYHFPKGNVEIFYLQQRTNEKPWKTSEAKQNRLSFRSILRLLSFDEVIFPGWYNWRMISLYLLLKILGRRPSLFLDHLNDNQSIEFVKKVYIKLARRKFVSTHTLKNLLDINGLTRVFVLPYGLTDKSFYSKASNRGFNNVRSVFIANRFIERKGWRNFLKASSDLNINLVEELRIAGTGELRHEITAKLKECYSNVISLGWLEVAEYCEEMINCHVYLHFSDFEPFGIPPLDAFVLGKIIVVSDTTFSVLPFKNSVGVYIFKAGNAKSMSNTLEKALSDSVNISLNSRYEDFVKYYPVYEQ